ncbi:MAG: hypothetical protein JKY22_10135 [Flavobacteriaceae bacterium]|nr:hypothetical protein [Flavobacteriaceae bacterium]
MRLFLLLEFLLIIVSPQIAMAQQPNIEKLISKAQLNAQWEVASQHRSTASGVTHLYFR